MQPQSQSSSRRHGFTFVELLVVVAIVAVAMALLLPAVQSAREEERLVQCKDNLKQLGLALHSYHETHDRFPYSSTYSGIAAPTPAHTWNEFLLPYMDMGAVYLKIDFRKANMDPINAKVFENLKLPWQSCPSNEWSDKMGAINGSTFDPWPVGTQGQFYAPCTGTQISEGITAYECAALGLGPGSYCCTEGTHWDSAAPAANPGMFGGRNVYSSTLKEATDGAGSTFLLGERRAELLRFSGAFSINFPGAPTSAKLNSKLLNLQSCEDHTHNWGFSSKHEAGAHFLLVDGKVRFINDAIDYKIYCYLGDKADGNKVGEF